MKNNTMNKLENFYINRCREVLPSIINKDGIKYKLSSGMMIDGSFNITYAEFDGLIFNWSNKLIDKYFNPMVTKSVKEMESNIKSFNKKLEAYDND